MSSLSRAFAKIFLKLPVTATTDSSDLAILLRYVAMVRDTSNAALSDSI